MHGDTRPEHVIRAELHLNRLLFERRGDAFLMALTNFVLDGHLTVSEEAVRLLLHAVSTPTPSA